MLRERTPLSGLAGRTPEEVADQIADRGLELARLARAHGLDGLAAYLDMAILEAHRRAGQPAGDDREESSPRAA